MNVSSRGILAPKALLACLTQQPVKVNKIGVGLSPRAAIFFARAFRCPTRVAPSRGRGIFGSPFPLRKPQYVQCVFAPPHVHVALTTARRRLPRSATSGRARGRGRCGGRLGPRGAPSRTPLVWLDCARTRGHIRAIPQYPNRDLERRHGPPPPAVRQAHDLA